jgi:hypothetical protein
MKNILFAIVLSVSLQACTKDSSNVKKAEGFVLNYYTGQPIQNAAVYLNECRHTGTRCTWEFVAKTFTDANGYYAISGKQKEGALYITVGTDERIINSEEFLVGEGIFRQDFRVYYARYITTRFLVNMQGRNMALLSFEANTYKFNGSRSVTSSAIFDTTITAKTTERNEVNLLATIGRLTTSGDITDTLMYMKPLGTINRDTSVTWQIP